MIQKAPTVDISTFFQLSCSHCESQCEVQKPKSGGLMFLYVTETTHICNVQKIGVANISIIHNAQTQIQEL